MKEKEGLQIDLLLVGKALLQRLWIIMLAMLICGAGALIYARYFVTPLYSATAKMYVNNVSKESADGEFISSSELAAAQRLVNTYIEILKTPDTLTRVVEEADVSCSYEELLNMITAGAVNSTEVFYITVQCPVAEEAERLANTVAKVLPERISSIVEGSSVKVVQSAILPTAPVSPSITKFVVLGAFTGFLICSAVIMILTLLDNTIRNEQYPSEAYGLQTIVSIPNLMEPERGYLYQRFKADGAQKKIRHKSWQGGQLSYKTERSFICDKMHFRAAEAYKMLRTNLFHIMEEHTGCKVIGITSPDPAEGKSTLAINLAYSLAQAGKSVLLIEADLRKPVLTKRLRLAEPFGLSDMLEGITDDAVQNSGQFPNWDVLSAGKQNTNPAEVLGSHAMAALIANFRKQYDYILADLPPVNEVTDSVAVSDCLDGMLLVVRQNSTKKIALEVAMDHLRYSAAEVLGFVITDADPAGWYSNYNKPGYYGRSGKHAKL